MSRAVSAIIIVILIIGAVILFTKRDAVAPVEKGENGQATSTI